MLFKIQQLIAEQGQPADKRLFQKTYNFLNKEIACLDGQDKNKTRRHALRCALDAAEEMAEINFICASLLFELKKNAPETFFARTAKKLNPEIALLLRCYDYCREKLTAKNALPRFEHSFRVARLAARMKTASATVCAILLHDLVLYAGITIAEIDKLFGNEITALINSYDSIRRLPLVRTEKSIANLREMILAMAKDLRVIILKICSNIDYLKFPKGHDKELIKTIARESMDVLAPIADFLGIWHFRWQLEDYAFKHLHPSAFRRIAQRFDIDEKRHRNKYIKRISDMLSIATKKARLNCKISGRFKHFYSIYLKMQKKQKNFDEIGDVFALRVIVNSIEDCYRILGIIHGLWRPIPHRVKDYIASPKDNHYRSLHTTVWGLNNRPTEFQIRTKEMNDEARFGMASHWRYKLGNSNPPRWAEKFVNKQRQTDDLSAALTDLSTEFISGRIYVYTPGGDIISLPEGSTPIDFAYRVHSRLGATCAGALVNNAFVPLSHKLKTNDIVKIITNCTQVGPKSEWLKFVKTANAQRKIEKFINQKESVI